MTEPRRRRRPSAFPVAAGSVGAFLALFAFMALQLSAGRDPALGAVKPAASVPERVVVKRIERRVIVTRLIPPRPQAVPVNGSAQLRPAASAPVTTAPSASAPAPVAAAPAPVAAAPAPAPAPAPVVTRSS